MSAWQLLIRHAHRPTFDRLEDNGLSEKGKQQCVRLISYLRDHPTGRIPKRVFSSPKLRCVETAEFVAEWVGVEVQEWDLLDEQSPTESPDAFARRLQRLWKELREMDEVALCSHGDVLPLLAAKGGAPGIELKKGDLFWLVSGRIDEISPLQSAGLRR